MKSGTTDMSNENAKISILSAKIDNEIDKLERDLESVKEDVKGLSDQVYDISKTLDKIDNKLDFILPDLKTKLQTHLTDYEELKKNIVSKSIDNAIDTFKIKVLWTAIGTIGTAVIALLLKYIFGGTN